MARKSSTAPPAIRAPQAAKSPRPKGSSATAAFARRGERCPGSESAAGAALEGLEQMGGLAGGNDGPGVGDPQPWSAAAGCDAGVDPAALAILAAAGLTQLIFPLGWPGLLHGSDLVTGILTPAICSWSRPRLCRAGG